MKFIKRVLSTTLYCIFVFAIFNKSLVLKAVEEKTYSKITTMEELTTGDYLIVYEQSESEARILNGLDAASDYYTESIIDNSITTSQNQYVTITKKNEGYTILVKGVNNNDKYTCGRSGSNSLIFSDSEEINTISVSGSNFVITSKSSILVYNTMKDQYRFRYYKPSTVGTGTGNYKYVSLYKLDESSTPLTTFSSLETKSSLRLSTKESIQKVDLRFGVKGFSYDLYNQLNILGEDVKYGVEIKNGVDSWKSIECAPVRVDEDGVLDENGINVQFAVVIENIPQEMYGENIIARVYVMVDSVKSYMVQKEISVSFLAEYYFDNASTLGIEEYEDILFEIATM